MFRESIVFILLLLIAPCVWANELWLPDQVEYDGEIFTRDSHWKDYEQVEYADIDGDGNKELIVRFRVEEDDNGPGSAVTAIYKIEGEKKIPVKIIMGGETPKAMDLIDIDGDGLKDLVTYDHCGNHYTFIMIHSYKEGEYVKLFENGTACYLYDVRVGAKPTQVVIGRENWDDKEFCYANSGERSLKEVYVWNGNEFAYSEQLSTTPWIGEKQALENTWQKMKKSMEEKRDAMNSESEWDEATMEYVVKCWNGGSRAFELFRKEREELALKRYREEGGKRLEEINKQLQSKLGNTERAGLLTEKAWINLALFDGVSALETATICLLESVQLDPDNQEYIQHLTQLYEEIWHDPKFEADNNPSKKLKVLKNRVMIVVNAYRIGKE